MFDYILVEGVVVLILATCIIRSIYAKQKHNLLYSALLVVSALAAAFIMMFVSHFFTDFVNTFKLASLYAKLGSSFNCVGMENFYVVFVSLIFFIMIFVVLVLATLPIVIHINKKEKKEDYYIADSSTAANVVLGILKAIVYCVVYLTILSTILPALDITLSSWLYDLFNDSVLMHTINNFAKNTLANLFK